MEASINFLVVLILAIFVFGMGLIIVAKMFSSGKGIVTEVDDKMKKEIKNMLSSMEQTVAIPFQTIVLEKGKTGGIVVGVLNKLSTRKFQVKLWAGDIPSGTNNDMKNFYVPLNSKIAQTCTVTSTSNSCTNLVAFSSNSNTNNIKTTKEIEEQGFETFLFPVASKGAKSGTYIFTVEVWSEDLENVPASGTIKQYDSPQKVIVIVK